MTAPKSYRPSVLELEDRSSPSGVSSLDWSPDSPFGPPPQASDHRPLLTSGALPKKPDIADPSPSVPPSSSRAEVAAPVSVPAQQADPLLRANDRGAPPTIHETVRASGPAIGTWTVTKKHSETKQTPFGWFTTISASISNTLGMPWKERNQIFNGTPTKFTYTGANGALQSYSTRKLTTSGIKYDPLAQAFASVTAAAAGSYTWTGAGSSWGIIVNGAMGVAPGEEAVANIRIQDPVTFPDIQESDRSFTVQFDPAGSWSIDFPPQDRADGIVYNAAVTITGAASSTVFGYDAIFSYSIALTPGHVQVGVTSDPYLKWNDSAVAQGIANAYTWDGEHMTYNGGPLAATLPVFGYGPGLSSASFNLSQEETATVTVPMIR
jgi:hypothetical protein